MPSRKALFSSQGRSGEGGRMVAYSSAHNPGDLPPGFPSLERFNTIVSQNKCLTDLKSGARARINRLVQTSTRISSLGFASRVLIGCEKSTSHTGRIESIGSVCDNRGASQRLRVCLSHEALGKRVYLTMSNVEVWDPNPERAVFLKSEKSIVH